ncbi:MAG: chemotaxis protein [Oscillatoria sp. SIO1A7]|nr:chemotaxis protein [Oscillatoria sp. SIO1A7]
MALVSNQQAKNYLKLGQVVPIGLGAIALLNLFVAFVSEASIGSLIQSLNRVNSAHEVKAELKLLEKTLVDAETGQRGFLLTGKENYLKPYNEALNTIDRQILILKKLFENDPNKNYQLVTIENLIEQKLNELRQTIELKRLGKEKDAMAIVLSNQGKDLMDRIRSILDEMSQVEDASLKARQQQSIIIKQKTNRMTLGGAISILTVVAIMIWFILRNAVKPINRIVMDISRSSAQIAVTVQEQERVANQQAASVNQTNATMNELGASSRQAAQQAEAAAERAQELLLLSVGDRSQALENWQQESSLQEKSLQTSQQVINLTEQLKQIDDITNAVSQLANQTNMLALNAAVEAVRAGEHGKGFGVIATEIRSLADESGKSTEKISALIANIQKAANATVAVTEESTKAVGQMVAAINDIAANVQQISLSAKEQSTALEQSVEAIASINQGAGEIASGIAQTQASVQELNQAAQTLKSLV